MARTYKTNDLRLDKKTPANVNAAPAAAENPIVVTQLANGCFQPGDIVSFRFNTRGTVLCVNGNGVQVDFGLGAGWFSKNMLTLVKAAGNS